MEREGGKKGKTKEKTICTLGIVGRSEKAREKRWHFNLTRRLSKQSPFGYGKR